MDVRVSLWLYGFGGEVRWQGMECSVLAKKVIKGTRGLGPGRGAQASTAVTLTILLLL